MTSIDVLKMLMNNISLVFQKKETGLERVDGEQTVTDYVVSGWIPLRLVFCLLMSQWKKVACNFIHMDVWRLIRMLRDTVLNRVFLWVVCISACAFQKLANNTVHTVHWCCISYWLTCNSGYLCCMGRALFVTCWLNISWAVMYDMLCLGI